MLHRKGWKTITLMSCRGHIRVHMVGLENCCSFTDPMQAAGLTAENQDDYFVCSPVTWVMHATYYLVKGSSPGQNCVLSPIFLSPRDCCQQHSAFCCIQTPFWLEIVSDEPQLHVTVLIFNRYCGRRSCLFRHTPYFGSESNFTKSN